MRKIFGKKSMTAFLLILFLLVVIFSKMPRASPLYQHYYFLSKSLLKGKLDVTDELRVVFGTAQKMKAVFDYAILDNQYFLHLGVFPAIFGIPFLIFGPSGYATAQIFFFLSLAVFCLTKIVNYFLKKESLLVAISLMIASPLLTTIAWEGPWYLSGLVVFALGQAFLWFYLLKQKTWGLLILIPLILTRPSTAFYLLIPITEIILFAMKPSRWRSYFSSLSKSSNLKKNINQKKSYYLALVMITITITFTGYNYSRFKNPFELGYHYLTVPHEEFRKFRKNEIVKDHVLSNAIYMLVNPPRVHLNKALRFSFPYFELSRFGAGLVFVIPWFLPYLLFNQQKRRDWLYWLTILAIFMAIITFKSEGDFQIGSRYACDFLPLLMFINLRWLSKDNKHQTIFRKLLWVSLFLNFYYFSLVQLGHIRRV